MKTTTRILLASALFASAATARADEPPAKKWTEKAQVSYLSANGNTKSTTLGGSNEFEYKWTLLALNLDGGGLGSQNREGVTAEQYHANEKLSVKMSDRNYTFEKGGWQKNRFAGIANSYEGNAGLGREMVKTDKNNLILEFGGGYVNEQRIKAPRESFTSGRAYTKYAFIISPTSTFSQDAEYLHNFQDSTDYRLNAESALTASVSTHMSLKVSYLLKRVGRPTAGFGKGDTLTSAALIFNY